MVNSSLEDIEAAALQRDKPTVPSLPSACWPASMRTTRFLRPGLQKPNAEAMRSTVAKWALSILMNRLHASEPNSPLRHETDCPRCRTGGT